MNTPAPAKAAATTRRGVNFHDPNLLGNGTLSPFANLAPITKMKKPKAKLPKKDTPHPGAGGKKTLKRWESEPQFKVKQTIHSSRMKNFSANRVHQLDDMDLEGHKQQWVGFVRPGMHNHNYIESVGLAQNVCHYRNDGSGD